jgi:hypothetical protein
VLAAAFTACTVNDRELTGEDSGNGGVGSVFSPSAKTGQQNAGEPSAFLETPRPASSGNPAVQEPEHEGYEEPDDGGHNSIPEPEAAELETEETEPEETEPEESDPGPEPEVRLWTAEEFMAALESPWDIFYAVSEFFRHDVFHYLAYAPFMGLPDIEEVMWLYIPAQDFIYEVEARRLTIHYSVTVQHYPIAYGRLREYFISAGFEQVFDTGVELDFNEPGTLPQEGYDAVFVLDNIYVSIQIIKERSDDFWYIFYIRIKHDTESETPEALARIIIPTEERNDMFADMVFARGEHIWEEIRDVWGVYMNVAESVHKMTMRILPSFRLNIPDFPPPHMMSGYVISDGAGHSRWISAFEYKALPADVDRIYEDLHTLLTDAGFEVYNHVPGDGTGGVFVDITADGRPITFFTLKTPFYTHQVVFQKGAVTDQGEQIFFIRLPNRSLLP